MQLDPFTNFYEDRTLLATVRPGKLALDTIAAMREIARNEGLEIYHNPAKWMETTTCTWSQNRRSLSTGIFRGLK